MSLKSVKTASQKVDLTTGLLLGKVSVLLRLLEMCVILSAKDNRVHVTAIDSFKAF